MNYLQLCQRLRKESGVPGTGPSAVTGQTGFELNLVDWIDTAYQDIQNFHPTWDFLRDDFSFDTTVAKRNYTPAEAGITDFESWKIFSHGDIRIYNTVIGVQNESRLSYVPWDGYRDSYYFGTNRTAPGRPHAVTYKPNRSLDLFQVPNDIFTVNGEYYKQADIMTADADIPIIPVNFHMIIVWRALMFYGAFDAADEKYSHGQNEYKKLLRKLEVDQLTKMTYGAPLA